jgi:putative peptide zinc metalloprotease protein
VSAPRRPRLLPGVRVVEQIFQGEQGFVAKSPSTGAYFRFRPAEASVIMLFTGERTVTEIADALRASGMNISAQSVEAFAVRLGTLGLVERTLAEQSSAQMERMRQERKVRRRQPIFRGELFRIRFQMGDPDRMLAKTLPHVRWCFTRPFVMLSVAVFAAYFVLLFSRLPEIVGGFTALTSPSSITLGTIVILWMSFLIVGGLHELGHAYTCKYYSGEVREMGVMLLYMQPAFYCNVNDAWSFTQLRHRLWVTLAGGWVELWLASLAAFTWAIAAPGTFLSTCALMVTILAGGLSLLSNANPLLPYDGYFALTDWLEIPNLRQRGNAYFRWWLSVTLLRSETEEPPVTERERRIFLWYGAAATVYTLLILYLIGSIVVGWATRTFGLTVVLTCAAALLISRRASVRAFFSRASLGVRTMYRASLRSRFNAIVPEQGRTWRILALLSALALLLPWSRTARGEWVALPLRYSLVTAPIDGVVDQVLVDERMQVAAGQPLLHITNASIERARPTLIRQRDSLWARIATSRSAAGNDLALLEASGRVADARAKNADGVRRSGAVPAPTAGTILSTKPELLLGKQVVAGTPLLQLGEGDSLDIRIHLGGGGSASVRVGQTVTLLLDADGSHRVKAQVQSVGSRAHEAPSHGAEARVRLAASAVWRPGMRGVATVRIAGSTVGGALIWAVRTRLRPDLLL